MIKLLDRQMVRGYFKAYAVCLLSLLSLYVVVDLFINLDDPRGGKEMLVHGAFEPNLIHVEGDRATRRGQTVREFRCTIPENLAGNMLHLTAGEAHYVPGDGPHQGKWELTNTTPRDGVE